MSPLPASCPEELGLPATLAAYRSGGQGAWDGLFDGDGRIRPVWRPFIDHIGQIGAPALQARFARADAHLASSGVVHRVYGDGAGVRPWPLSHMPVMISASEWSDLAAGVIERAEVLNALLADAYGAGRLVTEGVIPAALYAGSPEWARPMVDPKASNAQPLRFYAVDLARGPDGQWWVMSDRTQAPSGAGYALENRLAMARALPDLYRTMQIDRLAGFFQNFRSHLVSLKRNPDARIGLMSPGPLNETYFEHAYLANYLGLVLVEGEDLVVRDGALFIRTVAGLQPCDVMWRRVDSDFTDPLELNTRSRLGVPGLTEAARQGGVTLANAIGSGLAESRAWMAMMPALAAMHLGRPLRLPTQATWWGIDDSARATIRSRFDGLFIGSAFGAVLPGVGTGFALGASLKAEDRAALLARLDHRGIDIVAQEPLRLATTPIFDKGEIKPRPFVLRVFAAFTGSAWQVMPGGFARVSDSHDVNAVSLQRGGRSADVWVVSDQAVKPTSLLRGADARRVRRSPGALPSRAADNLFWLGRYVERTEFMVRLVRAALARTDRHENDIYTAIAATLTSWNALSAFPPLQPPAPADLARMALQNVALQSVMVLSRAALNAASIIRDRFSPDAWRVLNELVALTEKPLRDPLADVETDDRLRDALRLLAAFSGLAQENMNRLNGWRFLDLGRRIERGIGMARLIERFASDDPWACDLLLELGDSTLTYRLRYVDMPERISVTDLLMLDPANPRSVAFQMERIAEHLAALPQTGPHAAGVLAQEWQTRLAKADARVFDHALPGDCAAALLRLSDLTIADHVRPSKAGGQV